MLFRSYLYYAIYVQQDKIIFISSKLSYLSHLQQYHVPPKKKSSQTIPLSQAVTEEVPKYGRMNWLLGEKQKQGEHGEE